MKVSQLPLPHLEARQLEPLHIVTDDALAQQTGVRVAFSGRAGGVSEPPYEGLNLGGHVGDEASAVARNRQLLLHALGADDAQIIVPNQVHGTNIVCVESAEESSVETARTQATSGADGILVDATNVAALLCFADCAPVIIVSPTGAFVVAHAGWRGAVAHIASRGVRMLAQRESQGAGAPFSAAEQAAAAYNVYIGPCIHVECFETGSDVSERFAQEIGPSCVADARHVDLVKALRLDLVQAGVSEERIVDAGVCTACHPDVFYSYRASGGTCGRHGAIAFRRSER